MKTGFSRPSESNVQVYVDIGDPYPGRAEFIEYFDFANPALETPTIKSWGGNAYGQLGIGNSTNTSNPTPVGASASWKQVSAGALHTAAIKYDGTLWAWGNNSYGQVGDSSTTNRSSPVQIGTRTDWQQVSCGYTHTLAITQDGNLWAWGSSIYSQLGLTSMPVIVNVLTSGTTYTVPIWYNSNNKIECIGGGAGGGTRGGGGGAYAANINVQLTSGSVVNISIGSGGLGSTNGAATNPTPGGDTWFGGTSFLTSIVGARGGGNYSGGSASASIGQIKFSGGSGGSSTSAPTAGSGGGGAAGPYGNGGNGGSAAGPGNGGGGGGNGGGGNGAFAGGNGRINSTTYSPGGAGGTPFGGSGTQGSGGGGGGFLYGPYPGGSGGSGVDITNTVGSGGGGGGGAQASTVGAGGAGGGGYGGGGGAPGVGTNSTGIGGNGAQGVIIVSNQAAWISSPMQVGTSNAWIQVSAGGYHSLGITNDYRTYAWGLNTNLQCGTTGPIVSTPAALLDEFASALYSKSIAAGWLHSLAITPAGNVYVWGDNTYGQLGTGNNTAINFAKEIALPGYAMSISAHGVSSGAITDTNGLYTWGYNGNYNLGLGDLTNRNTPTQVGRSNWQEISMGLYHSVGIKYDGSLWSWGYNANGEIGNNTSGIAAGVSTPVQIGSLTNWKRASAGGNPVDVLWPTNGNVNIAAQGFTVAVAVATDF